MLHDILQLDDLKASYKSIEVDPYGNLVVLCAYTYIDENDSKIRIMHNLIHVFDQELNLISEHDFYPEHLSLPWKIRFNTNLNLLDFNNPFINL